jgi:hypothetical protein
MGFVSVPPDPVQRLADALHQLSSVAEAITWRLLELEERLQAQEQCLQRLKETAAANDLQLAESMDRPIGATEERLARIEAMLSGLEPTPGTRHLRSLQPHPHPIQQEPIGSRTAGNSPPPPGPAEGEQAFMDELIA